MARELHLPLHTKELAEVELDSWPTHKPEPTLVLKTQWFGGLEGQQGHLGPLEGVSVSVD